MNLQTNKKETRPATYRHDAKYYVDQAPFAAKYELHGKEKAATHLESVYTRGGIELMLRGLWTMIFVSRTYSELRHTIKTIESNKHIHSFLKQQLIDEARLKYPYCERKGAVDHDKLEQAYFFGNDARK